MTYLDDKPLFYGHLSSIKSNLFNDIYVSTIQKKYLDIKKKLFMSRTQKSTPRKR